MILEPLEMVLEPLEKLLGRLEMVLDLLEIDLRELEKLLEPLEMLFQDPEMVLDLLEIDLQVLEELFELVKNVEQTLFHIFQWSASSIEGPEPPLRRGGRPRISSGVLARTLPVPALRLTFHPPPPFDLVLTARVLRRSDRNPIDVVEGDLWSRVVDLSPGLPSGLPAGASLLRGRQVGARLVVEAEPARESDRPALRRLVERLLTLGRDLAPFWSRAGREPAFADLAHRLAGLRPQRFASLFEAFANGLCCQQMSLESGLTTLGRLAARCGSRPRGSERFGPPAPARVAAAPPSLFREVGLSSRRGQFLQALARLDLDRLEAELEALPDDAVRRRLLDLPGVGPWTAGYVMLRGLGRLSVFPPGDVGAARALGRILGRPVAPDEAPAVAARFAPLQGMLYFCMVGDAVARARAGG